MRSLLCELFATLNAILHVLAIRIIGSMLMRLIFLEVVFLW